MIGNVTLPGEQSMTYETVVWRRYVIGVSGAGRGETRPAGSIDLRRYYCTQQETKTLVGMDKTYLLETKRRFALFCDANG